MLQSCSKVIQFTVERHGGLNGCDHQDCHKDLPSCGVVDLYVHRNPMAARHHHVLIFCSRRVLGYDACSNLLMCMSKLLAMVTILSMYEDRNVGTVR